MATQQQQRWSLRVQRADGSWRDCGVFKAKEGGATTATESKGFPGGMQPQEAFASQPLVENVTLTGRAKVTNADVRRFLEQRVGKAEAVATGQPLDGDGNAAPVPPEVYTGILISYTPPAHDADSSDLADFQVEISTHGTKG
jgi:hypothetical protein